MKRVVILALGALIVAGSASGAPAPKRPAQAAWTPAEAALILIVRNTVWGAGRTIIESATCSPGGAAVSAGHFTAFQCAVTYKVVPSGLPSSYPTVGPLTLYLKVQPGGFGSPCVGAASLATVPAVCGPVNKPLPPSLNCGQSMPATPNCPAALAEQLMLAKLGTRAVEPEGCKQIAAKVYLCGYDDGQDPPRAIGLATIRYTHPGLSAGATVTLTRAPVGMTREQLHCKFSPTTAGC